MADIKVSELTEATSGVNSNDILYLVQSGTSKRATVANVVSNARIDGRISTSYLANLYDVSGIAPDNAQVLTWNSVTNVWEPRTGSGINFVAGVQSGTVSNVQLGKALNSTSIGNVTLTQANINGVVFVGNTINFHNKFAGLSFYWEENQAYARDGYWTFARNGQESAYIVVDGFPVADVQGGANTLASVKFANLTYVANSVSTPPNRGYTGNLTLLTPNIFKANINGLTTTSNTFNFHEQEAGLSMYWQENIPYARDGYWAFARKNQGSAYIVVDGFPVADGAAGANTLVSVKYGNVSYIANSASTPLNREFSGNLSLRTPNIWQANIHGFTTTSNTMNFHDKDAGLSMYWQENIPYARDGYWAFARNFQGSAYIVVDGYPVADGAAGANTLVSVKYGNVAYLKNDGGTGLSVNGLSANAYKLSANVFSFRYGNHTNSRGAYFDNDRSGGGFSYIWPADGSGGTVGLSVNGVHFNELLLEEPSGTSSQVYRGDGTIGAVPSDINLKRNVAPTTVGLDFIKSLSVKSFEMRNSTVNEDVGYGPRTIGFIAQDVYNAANNYVDMSPIVADRRGYLGIDVNQIVAALVNAVQTLSAEVDQLKNR